jgi:DNA-binding response OmpR family regulator
MFSADDFLKTRLKAHVGGAKGYLPKPFNLRSFQKYIAEWMASRKEG